MIGAISNVSFGEATAQDLINSPGKYSVQPKIADIPADSFESESSKSSNKKGLVAAGAVLAALAAVFGLGAAVSKGKIKINKIPKAEIDGMSGTSEKLWAKTKNLANSAMEQAGKLYDNTLGKLFGSKAEKAAEAAEEVVEEAAEKV